MKKWLAFLVTMIVFGWHHAPVATAASVWHTSTVRQVYPLANGAVVIRFNTDSAQCTNTNLPKYYLLEVGQNSVSADGFKNMFSAFMAVLAMGAQVQVNFDDSTSSCYINRMRIDG